MVHLPVLVEYFFISIAFCLVHYSSKVFYFDYIIFALRLLIIPHDSAAHKSIGTGIVFREAFYQLSNVVNFDRFEKIS